MSPKIFGTEHVIYMVISFALTIVAVILLKKYCKSDRLKALTVKICGAVMIFAILINRLTAVIYFENERYFPYSLCATVSLVFGFLAVVCKKDSMPLHFISYTAIISGLIPTIYPHYLNQGSTIFFPPTLTSLFHHSLSFFLALLIFVLGYVKPDLKKWHAWPLGYCTFVVYGLFNVKILGQESMSINSPVIAGTPFNWFYMGLMFFAVYTVFLVTFDIVKNKKNCLLIVGFKNFINFFKK